MLKTVNKVITDGKPIKIVDIRGIASRGRAATRRSKYAPYVKAALRLRNPDQGVLISRRDVTKSSYSALWSQLKNKGLRRRLAIIKHVDAAGTTRFMLCRRTSYTRGSRA